MFSNAVSFLLGFVKCLLLQNSRCDASYNANSLLMPLGTHTLRIKPDLVMTPESFCQNLNIMFYAVINKMLDLLKPFELSCCLFFPCQWVALGFMAGNLVDV